VLRHIQVLLARAEKDFRDRKSPLAEWPIFHQREEPARSHIPLRSGSIFWWQSKKRHSTRVLHVPTASTPTRGLRTLQAA